jgi:ArsR family transcriptional regulator, cadmium/lead-responsive transcriptional repressor
MEGLRVTRSTSADLELKENLFRGLAEPSRLTILEALRDGALSVTGLVGTTRLSLPNVSNHLACLQGCGPVVRERRGRRVYYRSSGEDVAMLLGLTDHVLAEVKTGLCTCPCCNSSRGPTR